MFYLLALSDSQLTTIVGGIVALGLGWLQLRTQQIAKEASAAAVEAAEVAAVKVDQVAIKAEEVKTTLDETTKVTDKKLDNLAKTTEATHTLVNSASLVQLRLYAVAARRIADLTNEPADVEAAELAEKLAKEHQAKQDKVDKQQSKNSN